ncbi:MAG: hypothetical protein GX161_13775, partial [Firmicutes bacterium]|nr:hypothetical protein [Bacillota bacterium]
YMYMALNHTGYQTNALRGVLTGRNFATDFRVYGWGPWHEFGHTYQQRPWTWSGMGEVTNNIYALSVARDFGWREVMFVEGAYERAFRYLRQPNKSFYPEDDPFAKLVMLWQLDLAFGPEFYPRVHREYRELPAADRPESDFDKIQTFILITSQVADRNLTPFYAAWGLPVAEATAQQLERLPELTEPIWWLTDTGYRSPEVWVRATEGFGLLGRLDGATLTRPTPVEIVAPNLTLQNVELYLDDELLFAGGTLTAVLVEPEKLAGGRHTLKAVVRDNEGRTHTSYVTFGVRHFQLIEPRRADASTMGERLRGNVAVRVEPHLPVEALGSWSVSLRRVVVDLAQPDTSQVAESKLQAGDSWPIHVVVDTTAFEDGAYDLVIRAETVYGVVSEISERVVLDNWEELEDPIRLPTGGWFGFLEQLRTVDKSDGWEYSSADPDAFGGDANRIFRSAPSDQYLTWKLERLGRVELTLYSKTTDIRDYVLVQSSADGQHWSDLSYTLQVDAGESHPD